MFSHLTSKVEESEILHPVIVVHHLCSIGFLAVKVEELSHLLFDTLLIVAEGLVVEEVTLLTLSRGVTNHTRCSSHEDDRLMSTALEVT